MKTALLQLNYTVGDIDGNADKIISAALEAHKKGAELCITSELALLGYPPRDLLMYNAFIDNCIAKTEAIAKALQTGPALLIGSIDRNPAESGRDLFNAAFLLRNGNIEQRFYKNLLPTYDVFDEDRYFEPYTEMGYFEFHGKKFGVTICEDIWNDKELYKHAKYKHDPVEALINKGVDCIINLSGSPFSANKQEIRQQILSNISGRYHIPVIYVNQVGGNDDLLFDGRSLVYNKNGELSARGKSFEEDTIIIDFETFSGNIAPSETLPEAEIFSGLVMGLRDYVHKCGFSKVLLGLSGGIDSALTAAIAKHAFGSENVLGILMPSPHSSKGSVDDSLALVNNLGIQHRIIEIKDLMEGFDKVVYPTPETQRHDLTDQNIQARIRGNILMAISNATGAMLLTTGNKSELAVGYCTIYGDMAGGLAVISDVPKIMVYKICEYINKQYGETIPQEIIDKVPSAELKPDQTDQDSLPPYDVLDYILHLAVEEHKSLEEIIEVSHQSPVISNRIDKETIEKVFQLIHISEFKRKQAAPGLKVTDRAFGTGWRMPIAAKKKGMVR